MGKKAIVIVAVSVSTLVILFAPIIPIDETFTEIETYNRSLKYKVISAKIDDHCGFEECVHVWEVILQNIDVEGGNFRVAYKYKESWRPYTNPRWVTRTENQYLAPGETSAFRWEYRHKTYEPVVPRSSLHYEITAPTVTDTRAVTKHKTHYRSIIGILTGWV